MPAAEAKAGGDIQAVHGLLSIATLGRRDVDGDGEEDGDVHRDDRSRPAGQERKVTQSWGQAAARTRQELNRWDKSQAFSPRDKGPDALPVLFSGSSAYFLINERLASQQERQIGCEQNTSG